MTTDLHERLQSSLGTAFTLERELGGGGMSRVFVCTETALGRHVVVKVLPPELAAGVSTERFKREIAVAARLQHPHIVPLLSAGEMDGVPYFTMPFVGESMRVRLARRGELPVSESVRILREIASALAYAHGHGVVHRDIKPANVLFSGDVAMVADFGVAKALTASSNGDHGGVTSLDLGCGHGDWSVTPRGWCQRRVTRFRSTPTPSISTSTMSPGFICRVVPGVPV